MLIANGYFCKLISENGCEVGHFPMNVIKERNIITATAQVEFMATRERNLSLEFGRHFGSSSKTVDAKWRVVSRSPAPVSKVIEEGPQELPGRPSSRLMIRDKISSQKVLIDKIRKPRVSQSPSSDPADMGSVEARMETTQPSKHDGGLGSNPLVTKFVFYFVCVVGKSVVTRRESAGQASSLSSGVITTQREPGSQKRTRLDRRISPESTHRREHQSKPHEEDSHSESESESEEPGFRSKAIRIVNSETEDDFVKRETKEESNNFKVAKSSPARFDDHLVDLALSPIFVDSDGEMQSVDQGKGTRDPLRKRKRTSHSEKPRKRKLTRHAPTASGVVGVNRPDELLSLDELRQKDEAQEREMRLARIELNRKITERTKSELKNL